MLKFLYRLFLAITFTALADVIAFRFSAITRETAAAADLLLPESQVIETKHGSLHALAMGPEDGQTILLIHGSVGWAGLWRDTMKSLADSGYRAIALDMPPMGLSARSADMDFSRQAQGLRILAAVEALNAQPIVVAHSFGAGATVEAMMATPQAFKGAVLVAGAVSLGQDGTGQDLPLPLQPQLIREVAMASTITNPYATKWLFRRFVHRKESVTDDIVDILEYPFARDGTTETFAASLPSHLLPPPGAASTDPARYQTLDLPVMLIWGREDTVTPPAQAEELRNALGDAPIFWLNNTGHIPQIEAPGAFLDLLNAALTRINQG